MNLWYLLKIKQVRVLFTMYLFIMGLGCFGNEFSSMYLFIYSICNVWTIVIHTHFCIVNVK